MHRFTIRRLPSGNILCSSRLHAAVYIYRAPASGANNRMVWRAYSYHRDGIYGHPTLRHLNNRRTLLSLVRCISW